MKKFLSMLLVLTMVVTTLMGVMMVDVSAGTLNSATSENDITNRHWTVTFTNANTTALQKMATGAYTLVPQTKAADGEASYYLGTVDTAAKLGMDGYHINFPESFTFKDATTATNNSTSNYLRLQTTYTNTDAGAKSLGGKNRFATGDGALALSIVQNAAKTGRTAGNLGGDGTNATGKAYKYTFYAYSTSKTAHPIIFQMNGAGSKIGALNLTGANLYSAEGIPHKVDVYIWSDSKDNIVFGSTEQGANSSEYLYFTAIIDGAFSATTKYQRAAEGDSSGMKKTSGKVEPVFFYDIYQGKDASFDVTATDEYVMHPYAEAGWVELDKAKAADDLFKTFNLGGNTTTVSSTAKTGFVSDFGIYAEDLETALTSAKAGTTSSIKIFESDYKSPASIYTDYATSNVKVVDADGKELSAAELAELTSLDNHYFKINGVYVLPTTKPDYIKVNNATVAKAGTKYDTRIRLEDYDETGAVSATPYGGLTTGFHKYTSEPRSSFTFDKGIIKYDSAGYVSLNGFSRIKKADYDVKKMMYTAQFDMYVPEYSATSSNKVYISVYGNTNESTYGNSDNDYRTNMGNIVFTTNGKASGVTGNVVDLVGNAWNTIGIQFDSTDVATTNGYVVRIFVNGEEKLEYTVDATGDDKKSDLADGIGTSNIAYLNYGRLFLPDYTSLAIMNDAWYVGDYTPGVTDTTKATINESDVEGITVDNDSNLLTYDSSVYADTTALTNAMVNANYVPVYEQPLTGTAAEIKAAYDAIDGAVSTKEGLTYDNKLVYRWILNQTAGYFSDEDLTAVAVGESFTVSSTGTTKGIKSAKRTGEDTAQIVVTSSFGDLAVYSNICSSFDDICVEYPNLRGNKLVGFAVNETGMLPRVYTLQESGIELYSLTYEANDDGDNTATLTYRNYGGTEDIDFVIVVSATDANGHALATRVSEPLNIDADLETGVGTEIFTPDFGDLDTSKVKSYKLFVFDSLASAKAKMANVTSINSAYVAD